MKMMSDVTLAPTEELSDYLYNWTSDVQYTCDGVSYPLDHPRGDFCDKLYHHKGRFICFGEFEAYCKTRGITDERRSDI
jgi:hypothetical protein